METPQRFFKQFQKKPMGKISKLKDFFKKKLTLIQDKDGVEELTAFIEEP